jgi:hypothetical protein
MAGYVMKMSILVPNINHRGQKDSSFEVRHKAYARPLVAIQADSKISHNKHEDIQISNSWI